jgi:hypothetical protein
LDKFKCYSDFEKTGVIVGYIITVCSSVLSLFKFRMLVHERAQKLRDAGIKPTVKRIVFLQRTLANHSKLMLVPLSEVSEQPGSAGSLDETGPVGADVAVQIVRGVQRQLQEQLQQQQVQQLEREQVFQEQLKQQQQQMSLLQHQIQQLTQRLQQQSPQ